MVDGACKISSINQSINQPLMVDGACKISSINQSSTSLGMQKEGGGLSTSYGVLTFVGLVTICQIYGDQLTRKPKGGCKVTFQN